MLQSGPAPSAASVDHPIVDPERDPCSTVHLTVLVCTHDRDRLLERTLGFLDRARPPQDCNVDVLVVANACTDRTHEYLERKAQSGLGLPLRWDAEPRPGKSHALNRGIGSLESDWVAFVDDDHRVDPSYLEAVCDAVRDHPDADIFCGRILPDWDGTEPAWVHDAGDYRIYPLPVPRYDLGSETLDASRIPTIPGGGNLVVRSRLFALTGPFSVDLGPIGHNLGGGEDQEWVRRAIGAGARLCYVPFIVQHHYVDRERLRLPYLTRKAFERSASTVRMGVEDIDRGFVPPYMVRKVVQYLLGLLTTIRPRARRYHIVRLASALGEIKGYLQARADRSGRSGQR